jgi:hypothetical protein
LNLSNGSGNDFSDDGLNKVVKLLSKDMSKSLWLPEAIGLSQWLLKVIGLSQWLLEVNGLSQWLRRANQGTCFIPMGTRYKGNET